MADQSGDTRTPLVSVIIVNYNVRELLLETLAALYASTGVTLEAIVVDNASTDDSVAAVKTNYPQTQVISLPANLGFGKANNAGLKEAKGRFVLILNPDVTVDADCVAHLADFLLLRSDVGAVGPRLVRPDGRPDKAARRGFPSPATAFYRLSGLSSIFPHSPRFGRYNMGQESPDDTHEIDSGTAACLMVRRSAIDRVGFFDPDFFMYGEDLDLCYRIKETGWKIFYVAGARAVHVKGQSTRQRTGRMLFEFHQAMWTFHHKHYADDLPAFVNGLIWAGTWCRWLVFSLKAMVLRDRRISA
ncbi:MAG TPA: glycosyltransferase family 2 protein [Candidatus Dormibacteraeota bacterium]|nr:glycosyltransferase family 2 protein [Candidatus Dormibacteraeota bacterium]